MQKVLNNEEDLKKRQAIKQKIINETQTTFESSFNSDDQTQENNRQILENKTILNKSTQPLILKKMFMIFLTKFLILTILSSLELIISYDQNSLIQYENEIITEGSQRNFLISSLNKEAIELNLHADGLKTTDLNYLMTSIGKEIYQLEAIQFHLKSFKLKFGIDRNEVLLVQYMTETGPKFLTSSIDDIVFSYIGAANKLRKDNPTEEDMQLYKSDIDSTESRAIWFIKTNAMSKLSFYVELQFREILDFLQTQTNDYYSKLQIIFILGIVVQVIGLLIVIPLVTKVFRIRNEVFAIFGMLPAEEITYMQERLDYFKAKLESLELNNRALSFVRKGNLMSRTQDVLGMNSITNLKTDLEDEKEDAPDKPVYEKVKRHSAFQNKEQLMQNKIDSLKQISIRSHLLGLLQFVVVTICYVVYFSVGIVQNQQKTEHILKSNSHLYLLGERDFILENIILFTYAEIGFNQTIDFQGENQLQSYFNRGYQNENHLFNNFKGDIKSDLGSYANIFSTINYGNMCEYFHNQSACEAVSNGITTKGMRTSIVTITEQCRNIINRFQLDAQETDDLQSLQASNLNDPNLLMQTTLTEYVVESIDILIERFKVDFLDYLWNMFTWQQIKFSIFCLFTAAVTFFAWVPYINLQQEKIMQTKSMLNMIPMYLVMKSDKFKQVFLDKKTFGDLT